MMTTRQPQRTPLEKLAAKAKRTEAQDLLGFQLKAAKIPHTPEFHWHETRRYRADFIVPVDGASILVEVDGGLYLQGAAQGGHTRGAARERDYERDAEAMLLGFRVLRVSPRQVRTGKAIGWIQKLLEA